MTIFSLRDAKMHLSRLVERAAAGEEIVVAKAGKPVAKLVSISPAGISREPGRYRGQIWIAEDFDAALSPNLRSEFQRE